MPTLPYIDRYITGKGLAKRGYLEVPGPPRYVRSRTFPFQGPFQGFAGIKKMTLLEWPSQTPGRHSRNLDRPLHYTQLHFVAMRLKTELLRSLASILCILCLSG